MPVPVMETLYKGFQCYNSLGINEFGAHAMQPVDEGDIVCVRNGHDRFSAATPHQFGFVTSVRRGVDGEEHSLNATVTILDGSSMAELSQDT